MTLSSHLTVEVYRERRPRTASASSPMTKRRTRRRHRLRPPSSPPGVEALVDLLERIGGTDQHRVEDRVDDVPLAPCLRKVDSQNRRKRDPLLVKRQQVWAQGSAALVTLWLGIEMGGPWWAAVIVALLVAVTTFATRRPSHDHSVRSDELGRQVCVCPAGQTPRTGWR